MNDLISRMNLYDKMVDAVGLALDRVSITSPTLPGGLLNPDYIRYYTQLAERTRFKEIVFDEPPAQPETCDGCKHLGKWENEVENGYWSPCTFCKRRVEDNYER